MRTTVGVDEHLLAAAKRLARERQQTLGQVFEDALRRELAAELHTESIEVPVFQGGEGPRPGLDLRSNRAIRERLDQDASLRALR